MSIVDGQNNNLTKTEFLALTTVVTQPVVRTVNEDIYENFSGPGEEAFEGDKRLKFYAGQEVTETEIENVFGGDPATFTSITPASGAATGGTDVTIQGTGFSGADSVTIGGAAATNFQVVDGQTITCTTPAGTAGAVDVAIVDANGTVTATGAYTYV